MFEGLFDWNSGELSVARVGVACLVGIGLGLLISLTYLLTHKKYCRSESLPVTLLVLPVVISIVIMLIGNNIAGAFSLAGIFSIIKFRSAAGNAKEIMYVLLCVAAGLAVGVGEYGIGLVVSLVLCVVMFVAYLTKYGRTGDFDGRLKVLVPEDWELAELEPVVDKYTTEHKVSKVSTKDLGSIFEVIYKVRMRDAAEMKEMIDELRTLNGNLKISYSSEILEKAEL